MNYATIKVVDVANGPGVRVSLFVSGCEHCCKGCFNPETWDFDYGEEYTDYTMRRILALCEPEHIKGLSILGGEPLHPRNEAAVRRLCCMFKRFYPDKTIWLYTGYLWEEIKQMYLLRYVDVLVDGPFNASLKDLNLLFRGSSNQRIIDVQRSLATKRVVRHDCHYTTGGQ